MALPGGRGVRMSQNMWKECLHQHSPHKYAALSTEIKYISYTVSITRYIRTKL